MSFTTIGLDTYWFGEKYITFNFTENNIDLVINICQDKNIALLNTHNEDENIRRLCEKILKRSCSEKEK
jgi:hypothetical protein